MSRLTYHPLSTTLAGVFKLGIYDYNKAAGTKAIYVKDVSIWAGNPGYQTVMGSPPALKPRLLG